VGRGVDAALSSGPRDLGRAGMENAELVGGIVAENVAVDEPAGDTPALSPRDIRRAAADPAHTCREANLTNAALLELRAMPAAGIRAGRSYTRTQDPRLSVNARHLFGRGTALISGHKQATARWFARVSTAFWWGSTTSGVRATLLKSSILELVVVMSAAQLKLARTHRAFSAPTTRPLPTSPASTAKKNSARARLDAGEVSTRSPRS